MTSPLFYWAACYLFGHRPLRHEDEVVLGELHQMQQLVIADVLVSRRQAFRIDRAALDERGGKNGLGVQLSVSHIGLRIRRTNVV